MARPYRRGPRAGWMALALLLAACAPSRVYVAAPAAEPPPPAETPVYTVVLVGGLGAGPAEASVLPLLRTVLQAAGEQAAVVFLGDDAPADPAEAERRLQALAGALADFPGRVILLPGDAEVRRGAAARAAWEAAVEARLGRGNVLLPDDGFPGPTPLALTDALTLVVLNTPWWLDAEKAFGDTGTYDLREPTDFLLAFREVLYEHRDRELLVVGHHPLFSNGPHAGYASWRRHLLPLPLLGSVGPLYRRFVGRPQDLAHARYRLFRQEMLDLFASRETLIYAAGHERSLQYFRKAERKRLHHYLVSGAGAAARYAAPGHGAAFTAGARGLVALQYHDDGAVWMEAWAPDGPGGRGRVLFRERLQAPSGASAETPPPAPAAAAPAAATVDYRDSTVVQAANPAYARVRGLRALLLGSNRRALWGTPVRVPVLDVAHTGGGLTPIKVGGNSQSVVVWMQGGDGKVYMLRSLDKVAGRFWPPEMRRTVARTMVQDQVAMLHPFGALVVPPLADAAGVYHTHPRLVYVPDDPRLGPGRAALAGQVALLEERPDGDMSDVASMGHASNVIGTEKLFKEIDDDNDHRVDARAYARARLLDMLLADHDRTTDNFRWAAFEPYERDPSLEGAARTQGKVYVPVPRDRDMALMRVNGLLPTLYRLLAEPHWQPFERRYGYLRGLNQKGLAMDRRFTAALGPGDWVEIADSLRAALTDAVLEAAVAALPAAVAAAERAATVAVLQARRDRLPRVAARYAAVLAGVVDVVGSNKHERFEVTRRDDATEVVVYKTTKEGDLRQELYRRTLPRAETREIRLYGLGGEDQFVVDGRARDAARLVVVGGAGEDVLVDASAVRGPRRRTHFFDTRTGTRVTAGGEARVTLRDDPRVNHYDREGFAYDLTRPLAAFGSNKDDGVVLGLGVQATRHGFRKAPYARRHRLRGDLSTRTRALSLHYAGHYVGVVGGWDALLDVRLFDPNTYRNFYGFGNETVRTGGDGVYYRARLARVQVNPALARTVARGVQVRVGPTLAYTDVRDEEDRFVGHAGIPAGTLGRLFFAGAEAALRVEAVDYAANPKQGFRFHTRADVHADLTDAGRTFVGLGSAVTLYLSPSLAPQVTLATRVGGAHNVGRYPFFAASTLGGKENLRGYRSTRFAGRSSLYHNTELRVQLRDFAGYLGYGELGLLGFLDQGRVWHDGESSRRWHRGYGGGLWVHLFDAVVVTGTYGRSAEDRTFTLGTGFLF